MIFLVAVEGLLSLGCVVGDAFYQRMQNTASRLLKQFEQGTIIYNAPGTNTGSAHSPVMGPPTPYTLDATASGVGQMYRNSTLIVETDKLVTAAVFAVPPTVEGTVDIDGVTHQVVQVKQIPAAGLAVTWIIVCRK